MDNINGYQIYTIKPNTIHPKARVYMKTFNFDTNNEFKNRLVRVYIPSTYDFNNPNKRFKVIYMLDGKNLFDDYTSFVGEWHIDESIEKMIEDKTNEGYIVVGIDAPNTDTDRSLEMSPAEIERNRKYAYNLPGYAHILAEFIMKTVKNDIDKTFYTLPNYTGVAGSSMGGLMALYLALTYSKDIKFCLSFSPAIFLFKWNSFKKFLDQTITKDIPKMFFYVGGQGFERVFIETTIRTYNYLIDHGFSHESVNLLIDTIRVHNEKAWGDYFPSMLIRIDK